MGGGALGRSSLGGGGTTRPLAAEDANMQYTTQTSDFATIVFRQKALGFNAVRVPFRSSLWDAWLGSFRCSMKRPFSLPRKECPHVFWALQRQR